MNLKAMQGLEGGRGKRYSYNLKNMFKLLKNDILKRKHPLFIFYTVYKRYVYLEPRKNSLGEALC